MKMTPAISPKDAGDFFASFPSTENHGTAADVRRNKRFPRRAGLHHVKLCG